MSVSFKALLIVWPLLFVVFAAAVRVFGAVEDPKRLTRWAAVFLAATATAFLIPQYWVATIAVSLLILVLGAKEPLRPALFILVLFVVPPDSKYIPGFAGINKLIPFNVPIAMTFALLVPTLFQKIKLPEKLTGQFGGQASGQINGQASSEASGLASAAAPRARIGGLTSMAVLAYTALICLLAFRNTSLTDGVRIAIVETLSIAVIYFAVIKGVRTADDLRAIALALVMPLLALAAVAVVELAMQWHFYTDLKRSWSLNTSQEYIRRAGSIRSFASQADTISYGIYTATALTVSLAFLTTKVSRVLAFAGFALFAAALLATLSRGPWLAAAVGILVFVAVGPKAMGRMFQLGLLGVAVGGVLMLTPFGGVLIDMIPFIGNTGDETIGYRSELFRIGASVVADHPLFGVPSPHSHPKMQPLVQGQGIVDIVNNYLSVALHYGLTGLSIFVFAHCSAAFALWRRLGAAERIDPALGGLMRAFFAAYCGFIIAIATTSPVGLMMQFGWFMAGLAIAAARVIATQEAALKNAPAISPDANDNTANNNTTSDKTRAYKPAEPTPKKARPINMATTPKHLRQYVSDK